MAAVAAYHLDRPVKITLSRRESLGISTKRHPYHMKYELGMTSDGIISYIDAEILSDSGPYSNRTARVLDQSCIFSMGPYRVHNARVRGYAVRTNNVPTSAFRGFGVNQVSFALESLMDEAAEALHIDPFELRLKNALQVGDTTFPGETLHDSVGIYDTILACQKETKKVVERLSHHYPKQDRVLSVGFACAFKNVGAGKGKRENGSAILTANPDGCYKLCVTGVDMGQGFYTVMRQVASEALKVPIDKIMVNTADDTGSVPFHNAAIGERQTLACGSAVLGAVRQYQQAKNDGLVLDDEPFTTRFDFLAPPTYGLQDVSAGDIPQEEYRNYAAYAYTAQAVVIEANTCSGEIRILHVISAHDCGRLINPHSAEGQVEGSCAMGIGYALSEKFPVKNGKIEFAQFGKLGLPVIGDTPDYSIIFIEDPEPLGPFGAKGISEIATVPITPAITNAIYRVFGHRIRSLPYEKDKDMLHRTDASV